MRLNNENKKLRLLFCIVFAYFCSFVAKIGCGSEKKIKTLVFILLFARLALYLSLRGEYRMRLNNENKKHGFSFCIVFGFHYICSNFGKQP